MEDGGWRILGNNDRMADGGDGGGGGRKSLSFVAH
jgi:hypothetical protein